jgi:hypothetical protein
MLFNTIVKLDSSLDRAPVDLAMLKRSSFSVTT